MYADKDYYYITTDGRATGSVDIYSDGMTKVVQEEDYIYGQCGGCEDFYPFREIMRECMGDPWLLTLQAKNDTYKSMFGHMGTLVASTKHGMYHVERTPHPDDNIEADPDKRPKLAAFPVEVSDLPVYDGSGRLHVQGALAGVKKLTPKIVEDAIRKCYKVNMTIGGKIKTVKIKRK